MNSKAVFIFLLLLIVSLIPADVSAQNDGYLVINVEGIVDENETPYSGIREIVVTASHPLGIWWIRLNIDGVNEWIENDSVLTYSWDTTMEPDGEHHIQIVAAVNTTLSHFRDFDVFVNNTAPVPMDITIKGVVIGVVIAIIFGIARLVLQSDLITRRKYEAAFVIVCASIVISIAGWIWVYL